MPQSWHNSLLVFPLVQGEKHGSTGWQKAASNDPYKIAEWRTRLHCDFGIKCGAESDLLVIDEDAAGALALLEQIVGKPFPTTHIVHTSKDSVTGFQKRQHYFRHPRTKTAFHNWTKICGGIDIRTEGGLVVAAGSRSIPNHDYESQDDLEPVELPLEFIWAIEKLQAEKKRASAKPSSANSDSPGKIKEGGRNATLTSRAGELRAKNFTRAAIDAALQAENLERCEPPLPASEVSAIAASVAQYSPAEAKTKTKRKLFLKISKSIADVPAEVLYWIWHNIILAGALNLFVGLPDVGKTLVCIFIIARLTCGERFPFSKRSIPPKKVLVICREDSYATMWVPRLRAAGADLSMVIPVHGIGIEGSDEVIPWFLDEQEHRAALKEVLLSDPEIAACIIDPLADMLGHKDMNKADDIRAVMGPLGRIAQETKVAMIVNVHTTKALIDSVIKSAAGSIQLMAAVQVSWLFIEDSDVKGQRLMLQGRNKSGKKRGFKYRIESAPWPAECGERDLEEGEEDDGVGLVVFKGPSDADANDILQRKLDKDEPKNKQIRKWLLELLSRGPVPNHDCNREAQNRGFARDYVTRICTELGVVRNGKTWALPETKQPNQQQDAVDSQVSFAPETFPEEDLCK